MTCVWYRRFRNPSVLHVENIEDRQVENRYACNWGHLGKEQGDSTVDTPGFMVLSENKMEDMAETQRICSPRKS